MSYAVLTPSKDTSINITETREITHNGQSVGNPQVGVERTAGTYTSTVPLKLPSNADKGVYIVRTTIQSGNSKDTREISFDVL